MLTTALLLFQLAALVAIVLRVVAAERAGRARPRPARARRAS
jgi:hypothetical protein